MSPDASTVQRQPTWQPEVLEGLRRQLDDEHGVMIAEIVALYLSQAADLLDKMSVAVEDADTNQLSELAHSLKGSTLAVGGARLAVLCSRIELGAYPERQLVNAVQSVRDEYDALAAALSSHYHRQDRNSRG
jgi:HPt (histidine-containing phosphotransfer) domain-containing protein